MKTLGEVLALATQFLKEKGFGRARRDAEVLLAHVLGVPRLDLYLQFDRPLQEAEIDPFRKLLKRMLSHEPVEYIIGSVDFYGVKIGVSRDVLIPRPETEILLDGALKRIKREGVAWDICCGSGCIGIALKKASPDLKVILSDMSPAAVKVARANGGEVREGDLFAPFKGERADYIFCNPPYVTTKEWERLDRSVKEFEPKLALVGGEDGLLFYRRLAEEAPSHLNAGGLLFLEIGSGQGDDVQAIFNASHWKRKVLEKDWSGHDRFFFLEFE